MKKLLTLFLLAYFPLTQAHGGVDHEQELKRNGVKLNNLQKEYRDLESRNDEIDSLERQVRIISNNLLILRNLMAKDYPHVKQSMSKYKLDYMESLDRNLKELKETISLLKETLDVEQ